MDLQIVGMGDGALLGFTYFGKGDNVVDEESDWTELNIYLFIVCFKFRWW